METKKEESSLSLVREDVLIAAKKWRESRDMGKQLFSAIDELLLQYGLQAGDIGDFVVRSSLPSVYTGVRIAETVKKVYTFGVMHPSSSTTLK